MRRQLEVGLYASYNQAEEIRRRLGSAAEYGGYEGGRQGISITHEIIPNLGGTACSRITEQFCRVATTISYKKSFTLLGALYGWSSLENPPKKRMGAKVFLKGHGICIDTRETRREYVGRRVAISTTALQMEEHVWRAQLSGVQGDLKKSGQASFKTKRQPRPHWALDVTRRGRSVHICKHTYFVDLLRPSISWHGTSSAQQRSEKAVECSEGNG